MDTQVMKSAISIWFCESKEKVKSNMYYSIPVSIVLLLVSPLIILSILDCTFGPWSGKVCLLGSDSLPSPERSKSVLDDHSEMQSPGEVIKEYSKLEKLEAAMAKARSLIREAAQVKLKMSVHEDQGFVPHGSIYRNANAFHRSYLEMEKLFKVYVYEEGNPPFFHSGPAKGMYSLGGRFIMEIENSDYFRTKDPERALVYFLPFSVAKLVHYIFVDGHPETMKNIGYTFADYIHVISNKHSFWNRSLGADHFMLSCHDWAPYTSKYVPEVFNNSIRVLCNANTSEGFNPSKDASLPEIFLASAANSGNVGGLPPANRSFLAFFSGGVHGHIRYLLAEQWKGKDNDILVYEETPKNMSYNTMMKSSKYCLCPSGYEVASPRVAQAIYADCVPVLISDSYVPPFSDVLNWDAFSVSVPVKEIPKLKEILLAIPESKYLELQKGVKKVQRHFVVNETPERFDVFHMILHSVWLRRLNVRIKD